MSEPLSKANVPMLVALEGYHRKSTLGEGAIIDGRHFGQVRLAAKLPAPRERLLAESVALDKYNAPGILSLDDTVSSFSQNVEGDVANGLHFGQVHRCKVPTLFPSLQAVSLFQGHGIPPQRRSR
jgi:hypothetical protein